MCGWGKGKARSSVCVSVSVNSDSHLHTTPVKQQVALSVCDLPLDPSKDAQHESVPLMMPIRP